MFFLHAADELTCSRVLLLLQRVSGPRLQDELALLVHLQLLHLHGLLLVRVGRCGGGGSIPATTLMPRVSHVTHLDAEGKLVT